MSKQTKKTPKGVKFDAGKPRLDLVPSEALVVLGEVLAYGANKYGKANWSKGLEHSRLIAATLRHLAAYNGGEDTDTESGLSHIGHALCNLAFLAWMVKNRPELDDRWVRSVK